MFPSVGPLPSPEALASSSKGLLFHKLSYETALFSKNKWLRGSNEITGYRQVCTINQCAWRVEMIDEKTLQRESVRVRPDRGSTQVAGETPACETLYQQG